MASILITGASGFIGSFLVERALSLGMETWAAVRKGSPRRFLPGEGVNLVELDLDDPEGLRARLSGLRLDYVIHAAGVTKALRREDFFRVNTRGTANLVGALRDLGMPLRRFVFISSLSVFGPAREDRPYREITDGDTPRPNTAYGRSKLMAERYLDGLEGFPSITLRLTGVYGPRDRDYLMMARSISRHVDFSLGRGPQDLTFLYVMDAVEACFLALDRGKVGSKYFISDGGVHSSRAFSDLVRHELGDIRVVRVRAPLWLLRIVAAAAEATGRLTGRVTALNGDKCNILGQRNWRCDTAPAARELGFVPRYPLDEGVALTVRWYRKNHWL